MGRQHVRACGRTPRPYETCVSLSVLNIGFSIGTELLATLPNVFLFKFLYKNAQTFTNQTRFIR